MRKRTTSRPSLRAASATAAGKAPPPATIPRGPRSSDGSRVFAVCGAGASIFLRLADNAARGWQSGRFTPASMKVTRIRAKSDVSRALAQPRDAVLKDAFTEKQSPIGGPRGVKIGLGIAAAASFRSCSGRQGAPPVLAHSRRNDILPHPVRPLIIACAPMRVNG